MIEVICDRDEEWKVIQYGGCVYAKKEDCQHMVIAKTRFRVVSGFGGSAQGRYNLLWVHPIKRGIDYTEGITYIVG